MKPRTRLTPYEYRDVFGIPATGLINTIHSLLVAYREPGLLAAHFVRVSLLSAT